MLYLAPPRELASLTQWERNRANAELYRRAGGQAELPEAARPGAARPSRDAVARSVQPENLDASELLTPAEIVLRTGQPVDFDVGTLTDLPRSPSYHGVHLRAVDHDESFDVSVRAWRDPPDGFDSVVATFNATLPGVALSDDVTNETWVADLETVRAVAFVDRPRRVAVLITCGLAQCVDISTTLILAKLAHDNLVRIGVDSDGDAAPVREPGPEDAVDQADPRDPAVPAGGEPTDSDGPSAAHHEAATGTAPAPDPAPAANDPTASTSGEPPSPGTPDPTASAAGDTPSPPGSSATPPSDTPAPPSDTEPATPSPPSTTRPSEPEPR
ncbi:MAG: hypothetical protein B7733_11625 [Myxococcales bacterium FL481]|nr:MAG: hypothetical protein B7733_12220 [Myxococcales bacterium FL481]TPV95127.1 MAG: hypothetical protein B7733_11625 [Myxococcales bacterium FL481]